VTAGELLWAAYLAPDWWGPTLLAGATVALGWLRWSR
jgi:hypothetical protein